MLRVLTTVVVQRTPRPFSATLAHPTADAMTAGRWETAGMVLDSASVLGGAVQSYAGGVHGFGDMLLFDWTPIVMLTSWGL